MSSSRLLIVECLCADRFNQYRSELFPFVRGWAEAQGVPVRWLAFGFDPREMPTSEFLVALPDEERDALVRAIAAFRPTHVLCNEAFDPATDGPVRAAAAAVGAARFDVYALRGGPELATTRDAAAWLGVAGGAADEPLVEAAAPDWACELVGARARAVRPYVVVQAGPLCFYYRSLARSRAFAGMDLTTLPARGCSFCGLPDERRYTYRTPPVPLALRQLRAAVATCPPERGGREFLFSGAAVFHRLGALFEAVLAADVPPSTFLFACRIDELRRRAARIEALLPRLRAAGHRIGICNMGVENFSAAENERFNKGITVRDVEVAHALVTRWERDFPEAFTFHEVGGFGFILFTPWTTLDDLRTNVDCGERFGVSPDLMLRSRLQLLPDRAIAALGRRDGLVVADPADSPLWCFDSGCIMSADEEELPWRFLHPATGPVHQVFTRLPGAVRRRDDTGGRDPLATRLRALARRLPAAERTPFRLARLTLDCAQDGAPPGSADELAERLDARLTALGFGPAAAAPEGDVPPAEAETDAQRDRRERLRTLLAELLGRLLARPDDLLRGYRPQAVVGRPSSRGWGELGVTLRRGATELRLTLLPREALERPFRATERFALAHDEATPLEGPDERAAAEVILRGLERLAARTR
jgi:hypothetical protein